MQMTILTKSKVDLAKDDVQTRSSKMRMVVKKIAYKKNVLTG